MASTANVLGSGEARLLIELVRANAEGAPDRAALPSTARLDWQSFLDAARRHRIGSLVLDGAERARFRLPRTLLEKLSNDRARELARTAIQLHELDAIAAAAVKRGRRIALLKGSWSSTALYRHPGSRPMADLDILVPVEELEAWTAELGELGYEERDAADHATLFAHRSRGVYVELHRTLTSCSEFLGLDTRGVLERSVPAAVYADPSVRTLSLEDHLLHLTLHAAFQHGMRQAAINAWDAFRIAERRELDVAAFLSRIDHRPLRAYVYGGLCLAAALFPHARLARAKDTLEASMPGHLARRARRLRRERLLAPSNRAVFGSPLARIAWVERPADALTLARHILRPRATRDDGRFPSASAYLARATQLFRNHVVAPLRALHKPQGPLSTATKASLEEVPHV